MNRHAAGLPILLALVWCVAAPAAQDVAPRKHNVVLVTLDGVRLEELFQGVDPRVLADQSIAGVYYQEDAARVREAYARGTTMQSRAALLPFFWNILAAQGVVFGNRDLGSRVRVKNKEWFSAPGYAELLTGAPHADVTSNDEIRYPHRTVLEFVQDELRLGFPQLAVIGSWAGFGLLASSRANAFFTNTGHERVPAKYSTPVMDAVTSIQSDIVTLWPESRSDAVTMAVALEYLRTQRPRLLYIAIDDSDAWAHQRRYDRYLDYLNTADRQLGRLWELLQGMEAYRGRTTLIVTTDHGRGSAPADWIEHGAGIEGSQDMWIAVIGPGTEARGEARDHAPLSQSDVAATIARCFGLDWRKASPDAGPPLPGVCGAN
jgi:hypothetical protein